MKPGPNVTVSNRLFMTFVVGTIMFALSTAALGVIVFSQYQHIGMLKADLVATDDYGQRVAVIPTDGMMLMNTVDLNIGGQTRHLVVGEIKAETAHQRTGPQGHTNYYVYTGPSAVARVSPGYTVP